MDTAFSPNTSNFLDYLSSTLPASDNNSGPNPFSSANTQNLSFAPSALFNNMPVPGRDTPEDTPSSSNSNEVTPDSAGGNDPTARTGGGVDASESDEASPERGLRERKNSAATGNGGNKRKAGHSHGKAADGEDEEDDDSESDFPSGHEDKRQHGRTKSASAAAGSGRKGARKSTGGAAEEPAGTKGKEVSKAARRKEQNRAAQKAFRERREAKVKDLEEKVAELEAKSYGATVENENLRGILKRLQEENVALKQSAFTFSMPMGGNSTPAASGSGSGSNSAPQHVHAANPFPAPARQQTKPPTPPATNDEALKSINELPSGQHRGSGAAGSVLGDSPESLVSLSSTEPTPPSLFPDGFNPYGQGNQQQQQSRSASASARPQPDPMQSHGGGRSGSQVYSTSSSSTGLSPPTSNADDIQALWASIYPNGVEATLNGQGQQRPQQQQGQGQQQQQGQGLGQNNLFMRQTSPFTLLNSQPEFMSFANAGSDLSFGNSAIMPPIPAVPAQQQQQQQPQQPQQQPQLHFGSSGHVDFNRFAFRDPSADAGAGGSGSGPGWDYGENDNGISEFLASLKGSSDADTNPNGGAGISGDNSGDFGSTSMDDGFNAQLRQIYGSADSPSALFNLGSAGLGGAGLGGFSPGSYLNMSPSPLNSASNSQSPQSVGGAGSGSGSGSGDKSASNSPESMGSMASSRTSVSQAPVVGNGCAAAAAAAAKGMPAGTYMMDTTVQTFGPPKPAHEVVHVVDAEGKIVKPSVLWTRYGMQHQAADHLMIDDLCDQMRAKATCVDGRMQLTEQDAEQMFSSTHDGEHNAWLESFKARRAGPAGGKA
ncbi:hypothetical protein IAT38_004504 [Cryptococcus sp. DSM 104549]